MFNKILFLGAHTDDELACSAALSRFIEEDKKVFIVVFSFCEESVPKQFPKNILRSEFNQAMKVLKINKKNIFKYDFKVRYFPENRQAILEEITILKNKIKPDLVLLPALTDIHQDHHTVTKEGIRAFNKTNSSIFGYEIFPNITNFSNTGFIKIKNRHLKAKIKSSSCYKSQEHRPYAKKELFKGLAKLRGIQSGVDMAEAFEIIKFKI